MARYGHHSHRDPTAGRCCRRCGFIGGLGLALASGSLPTDAAAVELRFWTNLTTQSQAEVIQRHANACAAEQQDVSIAFEAVPFNTMYTRLITALRRGEMPNVMNTLEGAVAFVQAKGGLVPVTDVVEDLGTEDFVASYLDAVRKDGEIWGMPDWALHQEVWYRKDLFGEAGLEVPRSWPELMEAAKTLTKDENGDGTPEMYGFAVPMGRSLVAPQTYFQFLYAASGTVFDPETGEYVFDQRKKEAVEALRFMLELYHAASPPSSLEWGLSEFRNAFVQGQVAMTNEWGAVVLIAAEQNPDMLDRMGVFPFPPPTPDQPPGPALAGGYYYLVGQASEEEVAASKALLRCMYTPERVAERANSRPVFAIPATESAFQSETYQSNPYVQRFQPELEVIFDKVMSNWYRYGQEAGLNPLTGQIEATTFIGDAVQNAALGNMTPEEAVESINAQMIYQLELMGQ